VLIAHFCIINFFFHFQKKDANTGFQLLLLLTKQQQEQVLLLLLLL
jgi:hypothetical protein